MIPFTVFCLPEFKWGFLTIPYVDPDYAEQIVGCPGHRALSLGSSSKIHDPVEKRWPAAPKEPSGNILVAGSRAADMDSLTGRLVIRAGMESNSRCDSGAGGGIPGLCSTKGKIRKLPRPWHRKAMWQLWSSVSRNTCTIRLGERGSTVLLPCSRNFSRLFTRLELAIVVS